MTTFKNLDKTACKTLRKDLESILEVLEDQHNIKINIGKMTYYGQTITTKMTVSLPDANGNTHNPDETAYLKVSEGIFPAAWGFKKWLKLGDTFTERGTTYTICGFRPRSTKYPLLAKNGNNKVYKFLVKHADADK